MHRPYLINPGRITRPAGAQANTFPAALIPLGVLGVGLLVIWLCWTLALAVGAFFAWLRVLHYSDDNADQRKDSLITTLMKAE